MEIENHPMKSANKKDKTKTERVPNLMDATTIKPIQKLVTLKSKPKNKGKRRKGSGKSSNRRQNQKSIVSHVNGKFSLDSLSIYTPSNSSKLELHSGAKSRENPEKSGGFLNNLIKLTILKAKP